MENQIQALYDSLTNMSGAEFDKTLSRIHELEVKLSAANSKRKPKQGGQFSTQSQPRNCFSRHEA